MWAIAIKDGRRVVARVDENGQVAESVDVTALHISAFGAEGGRPAVGAREGVYTIEGGRMREVMPPCTGH